MNASAWTQGYATDHAYTAGFYYEQAPECLNHACVLNGVEPVPLDRPFTYFELGCGQGMTALLLAASNPNGRFYAADFMPSHIATAQQLADAAQCSNLTLLESSFKELAEGQVDLPAFDFITMHGVYTWVSPESRAQIVQFIARYLKPGGIVYVSYNALPGWSAAMPVRRLMQSHAAMSTGSSTQRLKQTQALIEKLMSAKAEFFEASPGLSDKFGFLSNSGEAPAYLIHEYMHNGAAPLYHADVAADLSAAKLDFVGQATLAVALHKLPPEQQSVLDAEPESAWRETLRDFMINARFRKDIFVRGRRTLPASRQREMLERARMALIVPRADASLGLEVPKQAQDDPQDAVLDALAVSPLSFGDLSKMPMFGGSMDLVSVVSTVVAGGMRHAAVFFDEQAGGEAAARRFNRAVALQSRYQDLCPGFASPVLGNGFRVSLLERMVYAELVERPDHLDPRGIAAQILPALQRQFQVLPNSGDATLSLDDIVGPVELVIQNNLPMWRQLKAI